MIAALVILMAIVFITLRGMNSGTDAEPMVETIVEEVDYTPVLTVSEPLSRGHRVSEGDLSWIDWPTEALTPALIVEDPEAETPIVETLINAVVREPLTPGEPLVLSRFIRAGDAGIMAALLKPGMRAVTVRISVDTAAGGFIQPGDKVDVILQEAVETTLGDFGSEAELVASTIFNNVTVLAIDQSFSADPSGSAALPGSTATLELSPRDAERITVAQVRGDLSLVLRGFAGATMYAPSHATEPDDAKKQIPPVTIYRSGEAQSVPVRGR
ncbi:Flp pilus assembly protein CpaB [Algimonas porphyrae]|uniref:Flp pilus assembly protein CpaB n=2 Tax=Algimonas porphyrae TaxID=1128113 RepID=A0ABQ5UXC2_9PROT|nr:Flp pilus assembly protein CpaB [Algimonas porphyrae]